MKKTKIINRVVILWAMFLLTTPIFAHGDNPDFFQAIGKMYVVIAVVALIFIGLAIYLIILDNKISKFEKRIKK